MAAGGGSATSRLAAFDALLAIPVRKPVSVAMTAAVWEALHAPSLKGLDEALQI